MPVQTKEQLYKAKSQLTELLEKLEASARFNVEYEVSIEKGYFYVAVTDEHNKSVVCINSAIAPGTEYFYKRLKLATFKISELFEPLEIAIPEQPETPKLAVIKVPPCIQTFNGGVFDYSNISAFKFDIEEIAHALSNQCRFFGHTKEFYSVAQHCVHVSEIVPHGHAMAALLHDAAEAFCGDIVTPQKQLLPVHQTFLDKTEAALFKQYGVDWPYDSCVKDADMTMLATEVRDLMTRNNPYWSCLDNYLPVHQIIKPLPPAEAKALFLERFFQLQEVAIRQGAA